MKNRDNGQGEQNQKLLEMPAGTGHGRADGSYSGWRVKLGHGRILSTDQRDFKTYLLEKP